MWLSRTGTLVEELDVAVVAVAGCSDSTLVCGWILSSLSSQACALVSGLDVMCLFVFTAAVYSCVSEHVSVAVP
eukprot:5875044-Amphidinium_carterae.1